LPKLLITGGAGFIGTSLVRNLSKNNEVVIFDNEFRGSFKNLENENVKIIKGNITNESDWRKIPNDIESIFHLGAINGTQFFYEIPEKVLEVNVKGVQQMLDFVLRNNVKDILFASSSEVYGFPNNFPTKESEELRIPDPYNKRFSYSGSKIIGELLCINYAQKYGFDHTIVRFHNIYGPNMGHEHVMPQLIKKLVENKEFVLEGDGTETRSFCHIDDAIEGIIISQQNKTFKNRIFNIGNPEEVSINYLVELLSKISGINIKPKYKPKPFAGTKRRVPDISKLKSIGYNPKIALLDGFTTTYDWYNNFYKNLKIN
jgi:nucleoside-diphosphate-sugar epimerase